MILCVKCGNDVAKVLQKKIHKKVIKMIITENQLLKMFMVLADSAQINDNSGYFKLNQESRIKLTEIIMNQQSNEKINYKIISELINESRKKNDIFDTVI